MARRGWSYSADEAKGLLGRPDVALIDLREKAERERAGAIPGSLHAPYADLQDNIGDGGLIHELALSGKTIVFYCAFGERSAMAVQAAQDKGLASARHIQGGMAAWRKAAARDPADADLCPDRPLNAPMAGRRVPGRFFLAR